MSSDILVMPVGNGDMGTIPAKKSEVYPFSQRIFVDENQGKSFVGASSNFLIFSPNNRPFMTCIQARKAAAVRL
jgi:hypothetical protein